MNATFAPLPARAIGDKRLSGIHFRVLAAVALHDRLSRGRKNGREGQGCWASHATLARECGINYNNLSTALKELGAWGYLEREPHPLNKRLRVYRVRYDEGGPASSDTDDSSPDDEEYSSSNDEECQQPEAPIVRDTTKNAAEIVRPDFEKTPQIQYDDGLNIFRETGKIVGRNLKKNSAEAAPLRGGGAFEREQNVGAELAQIERSLKTRLGDERELDKHRLRLEEIATEFSDRDQSNLHFWANRLWEDVVGRMGETGASTCNNLSI